jgi:signal transduction histidine kinase
LTTAALSPLFLLYVAAFLGAAVGCFASVPRIRRVADADTRRGLLALLWTSGVWALAHVGFLVAPTARLKLVCYTVGLVVGFAAVGAWLYFCSAYTGRAHHRNPAFRRLAVVVFVVVTAVKLSNPLHEGYFTTTPVAVPFPHLSVSVGAFHWIAMGLSYALAFVGYFMLLELFAEIDPETRPLTGLLAITGLPVVLDVAAPASPLLVDVTYEPLGVAVFAVGVAFVYLDRFEEVRFAAEREIPVIALDGRGRVRDANRTARTLFPALETARGEPLDAVLPAVAARLRGDDRVLERRRGGETRYYRLTDTSLGTSTVGLGRTVVFADVTERERYRRELERQNRRLETFAEMVSHDLRNPLNVAQGRFELLREQLDGDSAHADAVEKALARMADLIDEILALAHTGQPVETREEVTLSSVATECWQMVETGEAKLVVADDLAFAGDPVRLKRLFENLFRNCVEHGSTGSRTESGDSVELRSTSSQPEADDSVERGSTSSRTESGDGVEGGESGVTVTVGALSDGRGFFVGDDGPGIPEEDRERVFETGYTTSAGGTGFGLAIVAEVVEAHGWTISVVEGEEGGARFEVRGVEVAE